MSKYFVHAMLLCLMGLLVVYLTFLFEGETLVNREGNIYGGPFVAGCSYWSITYFNKKAIELRFQFRAQIQESVEPLRKLC